MSLKGLLSKGCLSDKSERIERERNGEEEKQRDREEGKEREKGGKKGNLNQILNGLQISCKSLPEYCGTECKCKSIQ